MNWVGANIITALGDFFRAGGPVLYGILAVTIIMWTFIVERYWYFWFNHRKYADAAVREWEGRTDTESWYALRIRDKLISEVSASASSYLLIIRTCIAVLPLLGLLGTVTGMVDVFTVLSSLGQSNPRALAGGIGHATIPTMAGMAAAISGIFFSAQLDHWSLSRAEEIEDEIRPAFLSE
jgi:biopolymer transport protein ExbB